MADDTVDIPATPTQEEETAPSKERLSPPKFEYTAEQMTTFEKFKQDLLSRDLSPKAREFADDKCIFRFLRARQFDYDAAMHMITKCIEWRAENLDNRTEDGCPHCKLVQHSHCFHPLGFDRYNRPVVYSSQARAINQGADSSRDHMVEILEKVFKLDGAAEQWIWVIDFNGFGLKHALNGKVALGTMSTFANNFPERLGFLLLLNPPAVFQMMWSAFRPFLDPVTARKIIIVRGEDKIDEVFDQLFGDGELVAWIRAAMKMKANPGNLPPPPSTAPSFF